ncbi:MAG TPA: hypothetical protein VJV75_02280, partial [Candidatus Polarisedimenticolia bacterium]|nr:hypothetical protein [Candidatus Polarisedimenticolia bacterium]
VIVGAALGRLLPGLRGAGPGAGHTAVASGPSLEVVGVARVTHDPGISEWPTFSPDGKTLAFVSNRGGNFDIFVRRIDGGQEVNVTSDPAQDYQPAFSPDGNQIAFVSDRSSRTGMIQIGATFGLEFRTFGGDLWSVPALGGQAHRLARDANFPAWDPTGKKIAFASGRENHRSVLEVDAAGGAPRALVDEAASTWELTRLRYSPKGTWISCETQAGGVFLVPTGGGAPAHLLDDVSGHAWDPSGGRIFYLRRHGEGGTRLMVVDVDEAKGATIGEPGTVSWMTGIVRHLDVAHDGRHLVFSELEGSLNLSILPLKPDGSGPAGPEEILDPGQVIDRYPAFSPDGRKIAFSSDRLGPMDIWIYDREKRAATRLLLSGKDQGANIPIWTPDGKSLIVTRFLGNGHQSVSMVAIDGSQSEELIPPAEALVGGGFTPEGLEFLYTRKVGGIDQIFAYSFRDRTSRQVTTGPGDKNEARWMPDGRSILFTSSATGVLQLRTMPVGGGPERELTTGEERMRHTSFSPDGRWIYVQPSHRNVERMPVSGGPLQKVTNFPESGLFIEEPIVSPDGRFLAYCRNNGGASLWMVTLAQ